MSIDGISKFNRVVIVEFQFTFHYRDKWLEMNARILLQQKNTINHFRSLCCFVSIAESFFISCENPFEMQRNQQQKDSARRLCFHPQKSQKRRKIKGISYMWIFFFFVYTTVWSDWLNIRWGRYKGRARRIYWIFISFPHIEDCWAFHLFTSRESNDYCLMW